MKMQLLVISPYDQHEYMIVWLDIQTPQGNFVILPGYAPAIFTLLPNNPYIFCLENGVQKSVLIRNGILEVQRDKAKIIMNELEHE